MKTIYLSLFIALSSLSGVAQRSKVAYINTQELWSKMPEKIDADSVLEAETAEYRLYLSVMVKELQNAEASLEEAKAMNAKPVLIQEKEKDVEMKRKRIGEYTTTADTDLAKRREELYDPIRKKMQAAIDKVAAGLKYDYVLDSSFGNILYRRTEEDNILPNVLKELGIK
jgi:outer membrane protein